MKPADKKLPEAMDVSAPVNFCAAEAAHAHRRLDDRMIVRVYEGERLSLWDRIVQYGARQRSAALEPSAN